MPITDDDFRRAIATFNECNLQDEARWSKLTSSGTFQLYREQTASNRDAYLCHGVIEDSAPARVFQVWMDLGYRQTWDDHLGMVSRLTPHAVQTVRPVALLQAHGGAGCDAGEAADPDGMQRLGHVVHVAWHLKMPWPMSPRAFVYAREARRFATGERKPSPREWDCIDPTAATGEEDDDEEAVWVAVCRSIDPEKEPSALPKDLSHVLKDKVLVEPYQQTIVMRRHVTPGEPPSGEKQSTFVYIHYSGDLQCNHQRIMTGWMKSGVPRFIKRFTKAVHDYGKPETQSVSHRKAAKELSQVMADSLAKGFTL